jgi:hypothetical protein
MATDSAFSIGLNELAWSDQPWETINRPDPKPNRRRPHSNAAVTTEAAYVESAGAWASGWLTAALQCLFELGRLQHDWESSGVEPPNEIATKAAERVIKAFADLDFSPNEIRPSVDEGIRVVFRSGRRYADVECLNSGTVLAIISTGDGDRQVWEVNPESPKDSASKIYRFIANRSK